MKDVLLGVMDGLTMFLSSPYTLIIHLTFQSLAVTSRTTRFNIKKFYVVPTLRLCVLYVSQNKQQILPYKTLIFITKVESVYSAVRTESLYKTHMLRL
jgi:hypothetical protein